MKLDYWTEVLGISLDENGVILTKEQRIAIAKDLMRAAEMESEASGALCIPNPLKAELDEVARNYKEDVRRAEEREAIFRRAYARVCGYDEKRIYLNHGEIFISR
jgi:rRNA-processing protein FCF1